MIGWAFPNIFKGNGINLIEGADDVVKDLKLLFESEPFEFRFDPGYCCNINNILFRPKNQLTLDLLVDAICETQMFIPNVVFNRKSVEISYTKAASVDVKIYAIIDNNEYVTELSIATGGVFGEK